MSTWRRQASEIIPEYQSLIASPDIDSPMMLWIELNQLFEKLCENDTASIELLSRFWQLCQLHLQSPSQDVSTAAALAFCGHLIDTPQRVKTLPKIFSRADLIDCKELILYHRTEKEFHNTLAQYE